MKKILVTGGTTFVSKYVATYFKEQGYDVYVLNRNTKPQVEGVTLIEADRHALKDELKPMDVVLFRYRGGHVLHRILYREGNRLMIQGDGSYVAKEECLVSDVVGIVRTIVRPSGKCILVDSWRWQLSSRLWRGLGVFRPLCLRILHLWHHNRMRISW